MPSSGEKKRRKLLLSAVRNAERRQLLADLPAPPETLKLLLEWVDERLLDAPCDHTFRQVLAFIAQNELPSDRVIQWLNTCGAFCDCEALFNAEEKLDEALRAKPSDA